MKKNILILCGGKSAEHDISLRSAKTILKELDLNAFDPCLVAIDRLGVWAFLEDYQSFESLQNLDAAHGNFPFCHLVPTRDGVYLRIEGSKDRKIDVAFPVLHGPFGEDGTIQGLFEMMNLPYVGSGVTASSVGMDKGLFKTLMAAKEIPVVPFIMSYRDQTYPCFDEAQAFLKSQHLFIKPCVMGSSVGISKVDTPQEYEKGIAAAFAYSETILIEKAIEGRELECAILGNDPFQVTEICEIVPTHSFYSYEAKYLDPEGAIFEYAPLLTDTQKTSIKEYSQKAAHILGCQGLARVDFFATEKDVYINEINTMPGFTSVSMYPRLWQNQGVSLPCLISRLIDLAFQSHERKEKLCLRPYI